MVVLKFKGQPVLPAFFALVKDGPGGEIHQKGVHCAAGRIVVHLEARVVVCPEREVELTARERRALEDVTVPAAHRRPKLQGASAPHRASATRSV
jgi:hypothetical protein